MRTSNGSKIAALAVGLALVAAACGSSSKGGASSTTAAPDTTAASVTTTPDTTGGTLPAGAAMSVTYEINPKAAWNDKTPITWADFQCTWQASLNTPKSLSTVGYDQITSVEKGSSDTEVVATFKTKFAAYRTLFGGVLEKAAIKDCKDVTADFGTDGIKFSGKEWLLKSWSAEQIVYEANPAYTGPRTPGVKKIVIVPADTTNLKAGSVDFIFPQASAGIDKELADPKIKFDTALGGSYEALYFQQLKGPFADKDYREAFSKSIDTKALYDQIYAPFAQGSPLLDCGPIAPGPYCDHLWKGGTYDPTSAAAVLTKAGWKKGADGYWANAKGVVPEVRWMINTGNKRRESAQAFLIPKLKEQGFKVKADNCEATPCVFQTRLPALDYDLAMYINTVAPDPIYLTSSFVCDQIPSAANGNKGQNNVGWCNQKASDALHAADQEVDVDKRTALIKTAIQGVHDDFVMLPLLQFPNIGAYRTDKVSGTQGELANYSAFYDWYKWKDVDGDGQIVIGAEQYPTNDCSNPITDCASSSWFFWTVSNPVLPTAFQTTNDQTFVFSDLLASEPVVKTAA